MWHTILDLFTYPGKTLDRILSERNYVKSTQTFFFTMMVVSLSSALSVYLAQKETADIQPLLVAFAAIGTIAGLLVARLLFRLLVKIGLLLIANRHVPRDAEERRERSRMLYMMYPYHVLPTVLPAVLLPLVTVPTGSDSTHLFLKLILMIGFVLLSMGILVFQIVIMTKIVKRVYHVTTGQAFWGPMLAYFLLFLFVSIVTAALTLLLFVTLPLIR